MNKYNDKNGKKHGYWEEETEKTIRKGSYNNGDKVGVWVHVTKDNGIIPCKIFYNLNSYPFYFWYYEFSNTLEYEAQNKTHFYSVHLEEIC